MTNEISKALATPSGTVTLRATMMFAVMAFVACAPEVAFDVPVEDSATVQGSPLAGVLGALPGFGEFTSFELSDAQEFENNNAAKENVTSCFLEQATLSVTAPSGASLDFINELTFFVESPNEPREQVASGEVADGATSIDLDLVEIDLAPYVRDASMTIRGEVDGSAPSEDTTIKMELIFGVTAQVDGNLLNAL